MSAPMIHRSDEATRDEIADMIAELKAKHDRLPRHFEAKRGELMDVIDDLVDAWLASHE